MSEQPLPELRQVVLLTGDLDGELATARADFEVPKGFRDVEGMAAIGFAHEVFGFDRTYVEICEPLDPDSRLGQKAAQGGSGFMIVVQVADRDEMIARGAEIGVEPLLTNDHHGSPISQWHPRDFGTIAEIDQMKPPESWHFAPDIYDARSTSVVHDITKVYVSVKNPAEVAERWTTVIGAQLDGTTVVIGDRSIEFDDIDNTSNVYRVDCRATDRNRVGESFKLCRVAFVLV